MMDSKVNRTHKNVVGFMNGETYEIAFNEYIYNDYRDGYAMDNIIQNFLNPEEFIGLAGWEDMGGVFVKDNIRVYTWWTSLTDYFWEIDTDDEAVQQKVYEWAVEVYDEYLKLKK